MMYEIRCVNYFQEGTEFQGSWKIGIRNTQRIQGKLKPVETKLMMASFSYNKTPKLQSWF